MTPKQMLLEIAEQLGVSTQNVEGKALTADQLREVLPVDQSEVRRVAKRFRFAENLVASLQPLEALVRMGTIGEKCLIKPYYERVTQ